MSKPGRSEHSNDALQSSAHTVAKPLYVCVCVCECVCVTGIKSAIFIFDSVCCIIQRLVQEGKKMAKADLKLNLPFQILIHSASISHLSPHSPPLCLTSSHRFQILREMLKCN